jgi:hypothetical protein
MQYAAIAKDIETLAREHSHAVPELAPGDAAAALQDLAQFCRDCGVGVFGALALLMKFAVERSLADPVKGSWPLKDLLPAISSAYSVGWTRDKLLLLMLEMSAMRLHTLSVSAPEIAFYEHEQCKDSLRLDDAERHTRTRYEALKTSWLDLHAELDRLILHRENVMLQREALRQSFMRAFPGYIEERDQRLRLSIAALQLKELELDPTLTRAELAQRAERAIGEARAALESDRRALGYALTAGDSRLTPFSSEEDFVRFRKLLKVLWMILHPDRLLGAPLTEAQRTELRRLWDDCRAVNVKDAPNKDLLRSTEFVEHCIERAKAILDQAGIDIDPGLVIRGNSLGERIDWLERATQRLRLDLDAARVELRAWRDDEVLRAMEALVSMAEPERERERAAMRKRTYVHSLEAEEIERRIEKLLLGRR